MGGKGLNRSIVLCCPFHAVACGLSLPLRRCHAAYHYHCYVAMRPITTTATLPCGLSLPLLRCHAAYHYHRHVAKARPGHGDDGNGPEDRPLRERNVRRVRSRHQCCLSSQTSLRYPSIASASLFSLPVVATEATLVALQSCSLAVLQPFARHERHYHTEHARVLPLHKRVAATVYTAHSCLRGSCLAMHIKAHSHPFIC